MDPQNRRFRAVATAGCLLLFAVGCTSSESLSDESSEPTYDLIVRSDRAFDGESTVWESAMIGITDGRIFYVGEDQPDAVADQEVHLPGGTILPGFVDTHIHLHLGDAAAHEAAMLTLLENGVLAARDLGGDLSTNINTRDSVSNGPDLFVVGPPITSEGGHPDGTIYGFLPADQREPLTRTPATPEEAAAVVVELAASGVDSIKAVFTGDDEFLPRMKPEVLEALIDTAHEVGLTVTVHTDSFDDSATAIALGADGIEHSGVLQIEHDPDVTKLFGEAVVTPTLGASCRFFAPATTAEEACGSIATLVEPWRSGDLELAVGTDTVGSELPAGASELGFDGAFARELSFFVDDGFEPLEALQLATQRGAFALTRADGSSYGDDAGSLTVGLRANIIVVRGDATTDIGAAGNVVYAIKDGRIVVQP